MKELIRAAYVIARRDFVAIIFSKAFFFFLLGPLFPLAIGIGAGSLGQQMAEDADRPKIAVLLSADQASALLIAQDRLSSQIGARRFPDFTVLKPASDELTQAKNLLTPANADQGGKKYIGVLSGSFTKPVLTGAQDDVVRWQGEIGLLIDTARTGTKTPPVEIAPVIIANSEGARAQSRIVTAQAGQVGLFLLTMLLAGMVLSNLVEEKTNKIIEILAAAVPIDAIFLGKLFAMLGMAFIGIAVWVSVGAFAIEMFGPGLPSLPVPAIGWPVFLLLAFLYFAMAYLLLGSLFLGIGALATTVREVQTLSMPVTMAQLLVFGLASYAVTKIGEPIEIFAVIFPFSSPFAMFARAAQVDSIWPHFLALTWQIGWAALIVRISSGIFTRNVMKSGGQKNGFFKRLFARAS